MERVTHKAAAGTLAIVATAALFGSGCLDRELKALNPCLVSGVVAEIAVTNIDKVDLLFLVDNSGSMKEEQASLQQEFPKLIQTLTTGIRPPPKESFPPAEDLHLGVISSDMGLVGITGIPGCDGLGDDGIMNNIPNRSMVSQVSGCQATYPRFLTYLADVNDPTTTANDFACIANLGTHGCGFEQQLEAALKALWPSVDVDRATGDVIEPNRILFLGDSMGFGQLGHGDLENDQFLRNDATLGISLIAIIIVTDEEDCSSADTSHFTPDIFLDPSDPLASQDLNLRCFYNPQNLYKIDRYVNGFKTLRAGQENLVIFAAIAGVPADLVDEAALTNFDLTSESGRDAFYGQILADPRMQETIDTSRPPGEGNLLPSCNTSNGVAFPPRRIVEVAKGFGEQGIVQSICQDDFAPAMDAIIEVIAKQLGAVCLPRPLVRDSDGLVGCNVVWELPAPGLAPPSTPVACSDRPYLSVPEAGRDTMTDQGGQVCVVQQIAVVNDAAQTNNDTINGWFYDDFTMDVAKDCSAATPQRIAFTPTAKPETGVTVKLECLNETQSLANTRTDLQVSIYQPSVGDKCDEFTVPAGYSNAGMTLTGDAACAVTLKDSSKDTGMFCHPELNLCVLKCMTDADCPAAWTCDSRQDTLDASGGQAVCVNPTCGDL